MENIVVETWLTDIRLFPINEDKDYSESYLEIQDGKKRYELDLTIDELREMMKNYKGKKTPKEL